MTCFYENITAINSFFICPIIIAVASASRIKAATDITVNGVAPQTWYRHWTHFDEGSAVEVSGSTPSPLLPVQFVLAAVGYALSTTLMLQARGTKTYDIGTTQDATKNYDSIDLFDGNINRGERNKNRRIIYMRIYFIQLP